MIMSRKAQCRQCKRSFTAGCVRMGLVEFCRECLREADPNSDEKTYDKLIRKLFGIKSAQEDD